jgi:RND family efflux transporter MFP subunit
MSYSRVKNIRRVSYLFIVPLFLSIQACDKEQLEEKQSIRPVRAMKVTDVGEIKERTFPGIAKATQEVELSFRVSGPLITLPVKVGDSVKKGEVLARIDPRDFEVSLNNVRGQLDKALANAKRAQSEFDREMRILQQDPGATSQTAVDRKQSQRDQARADIKSLQASVASAKDQLNYTYLKAPFDGTIVSTYVENFEDVRNKQPIVRLIDDSQIEMVVNIPEDLISLTPHVTKVFVVFDSFPEHTLEATVKEIGTEASEKTRTFPVTLIMNQPEDIKILPGMAGKTKGAEVENIEELKGAAGVEIPLSALFTSAETNETYVWIVDEQSMTVKQRKVGTDRLTDHGIMVTDGLQTGEMIATAGVHYLIEGQQVKILQEEAK